MIAIVLKARTCSGLFLLVDLFADYFIATAGLYWSVIKTIEDIEAFQSVIGQQHACRETFRRIAGFGGDGFET